MSSCFNTCHLFSNFSHTISNDSFKSVLYGCSMILNMSTCFFNGKFHLQYYICFHLDILSPPTVHLAPNQSVPLSGWQNAMRASIPNYAIDQVYASNKLNLLLFNVMLQFDQTSFKLVTARLVNAYCIDHPCTAVPVVNKR